MKRIIFFSRSKRLGSVPLLNKYTRHKSSSNGGSSIDLSTSIVPEDFELTNEAVSPHLEANMINMPLNETTSALFRKRYRYSTYFGIRVHVKLNLFWDMTYKGNLLRGIYSKTARR